MVRKIEPPRLAGEDVRYAGFEGLPHAAEVDVDHVFPVAVAAIVQRLPTVADTGVGADDDEPAQLLPTGVHSGLQRVEVADVDLAGGMRR